MPEKEANSTCKSLLGVSILNHLLIACDCPKIKKRDMQKISSSAVPPDKYIKTTIPRSPRRRSLATSIINKVNIPAAK
jgi:hypothetical protein